MGDWGGRVGADHATYLVHWHVGSLGGHTSPGSPPAGKSGACLHGPMAPHEHTHTFTAESVEMLEEETGGLRLLSLLLILLHPVLLHLLVVLSKVALCHSGSAEI